MDEASRMTISEDSLECGDDCCNWAGSESEAAERDTGEESEFLCPMCGEICAHFPLDEIGDEIETVLSDGWRVKKGTRGYA